MWLHFNCVSRYLGDIWRVLSVCFLCLHVNCVTLLWGLLSPHDFQSIVHERDDPRWRFDSREWAGTAGSSHGLAGPASVLGEMQETMELSHNKLS